MCAISRTLSKLPWPNQIQCSNNPFCIGIAFRIAVTGEYLLNSKFGTDLKESCSSGLATMITDQFRNNDGFSNSIRKLKVDSLI